MANRGNYLKLSPIQLKQREKYVSGELKAEKLPRESMKQISQRIRERSLTEEVAFV